MSDVEDGRFIALPNSRAKPFLSAAAGEIACQLCLDPVCAMQFQ